METEGYLMFSLLFAAAILVAATVVLLACALLARTWNPLNKVRCFALFLGVVVIVGLPADFLWMLLFPGHWYLDKDHVYGFCPLWPFQLDTVCGDHFIGHGSYLTIEAAWLVFAAVVWLVAAKLARKVFQLQRA